MFITKEAYDKLKESLIPVTPILEELSGTDPLEGEHPEEQPEVAQVIVGPTTEEIERKRQLKKTCAQIQILIKEYNKKKTKVV